MNATMDNELQQLRQDLLIVFGIYVPVLLCFWLGWIDASDRRRAEIERIKHYDMC